VLFRGRDQRILGRCQRQAEDKHQDSSHDAVLRFMTGRSLQCDAFDHHTRQLTSANLICVWLPSAVSSEVPGDQPIRPYSSGIGNLETAPEAMRCWKRVNRDTAGISENACGRPERGALRSYRLAYRIARRHTGQPQCAPGHATSAQTKLMRARLTPRTT